MTARGPPGDGQGTPGDGYWHPPIRSPGFEKPSAIQQKGIVPFTKGLDVIQQAQSGTGKTATFCAGILNNIDYTLADCQGLVLAPTRELAQQIEKVMRALGDYLQVKCHACVGGTSVREDARILGAGVHVIVGTPGRVYDMLRRRCLRADNIKVRAGIGGRQAERAPIVADVRCMAVLDAPCRMGGPVDQPRMGLPRGHAVCSGALVCSGDSLGDPLPATSSETRCWPPPSRCCPADVYP